MTRIEWTLVLLAASASAASPLSAQVCAGDPGRPGEYSVGLAMTRSDGVTAYAASIASFRSGVALGLELGTIDDPGKSSYGTDSRGDVLTVSGLENYYQVGVTAYVRSVPYLCAGIGGGLTTASVRRFYVNRLGQVTDEVRSDGHFLSLPIGLMLGKAFAIGALRLTLVPSLGVTYVLALSRFAEFDHDTTGHDWSVVATGGARVGRITAFVGLSESLRFEDEPATWRVGLALALGRASARK